MRFRRWPRPTAYEDTPRKRAAFLRKQRLEHEALPLFADAIAATQRGVDTEMADRAVRWDTQEHERRRQRAARWREARARLFALPDAVRRTGCDLWRTCPYPADPASFADFLHQIDIGRIDPQRPPWLFHQKASARITPNPATFDEAFRQIGRRQVGGGPKTTPADELLFCGNLGSGLILLTSRVRLIEPNESFYTSSNHRLRDSHVGRGGHWVDIQVRGECSDAAYTDRAPGTGDGHAPGGRPAYRPLRQAEGRRPPMTDPIRPGQNSEPLPDEPAADSWPGQCKHCRHWQAPSEREQHAFERFRLGLTRRRVKRPAGSCDRFLLGEGTTPVFSTTMAEFGCRNFAAAPPKAVPKGSAFVTISQHGRIVWQGPEDQKPAYFEHQDLDP
ncbi:MAG: hypothetical protein AB7O44_31815 [Hyphomicrobiaceae bacterium]